MKIGIITYHRHNNFGALLQAYALQTKLLQLGADAEIIDYLCKYDRNPLSIRALKNKGVLGYILGILGPVSRIPRYFKCKLFRKKLLISKTVTKKTILTLGDAYDLYIAGSDNVWNYSITDLDPNYFLDFVDNDKKKGSYAASFGFERIPKELERQYTNLLKDFNYFYLRESSGVKIIKDLLNKESEVVLDPTMLLTQEEWTNICSSQPIVKGDYILAYQLVPSKSFVQFTGRLSAATNLKVIFISFPMGGFIRCTLGLTPGPIEWLNLIKNASYVVTDSFHGTAFSVLFHKNFYVKITQLGTRIENLLELLELKDRIIKDCMLPDITQKINYRQVEEILQKARKRSVSLLEKMLYQS